MDELKELEVLRHELIQAGLEYYVYDAPTMSDYEYDHKLRRLEELEAAHPEGGWEGTGGVFSSRAPGPPGVAPGCL